MNTEWNDLKWWQQLSCAEIVESAKRLAEASGIPEDEALFIVLRTL